MTSRIKGLERWLVRERTEIVLGRATDRFLLRWKQALDGGRPPPEPIEFARTLPADGFYLPTAHRAIKYLEECHRENSMPQKRRLLSLLLPEPRHETLPANSRTW